MTGNQNLYSTDNRLKIDCLSYTNVVMTNTFEIVFGFTNRTDVDWLLLSEVEFCQQFDGGLSFAYFQIKLGGFDSYTEKQHKFNVCETVYTQLAVQNQSVKINYMHVTLQVICQAL